MFEDNIMKLCTLCELNERETINRELMLLGPYSRNRCDWCRAKLEKGLKATFNMRAVLPPQEEDDVVIYPNFGPLCDPCTASTSKTSDGWTEFRYHNNLSVNTQINCSHCSTQLSYKVPRIQSFEDLTDSRLYVSSSAINDNNNTFLQKFLACCCFKCG